MISGFTDRIRIDRLEIADHPDIPDYPHYFPLSLLPDRFWDSMAVNPVIRVSDGAWNEFPYHLAQIDIPGKTGALFFRDDKAQTLKAYFIHFGSESPVANYSSGPLAPGQVWSGFRDAILLNEDPATDTIVNWANADEGTWTGTPAGKTVTTSPLEMTAIRFDPDDEDVLEFGTPTFQKFTDDVTILFMFKFGTLSRDEWEFFFGNYSATSDLPPIGSQPWRVALHVPENSLNIAVELDSGNSLVESSDITYDENHSQQFENDWILAAIGYGIGPGQVEIDINMEALPMIADEGFVPTDLNGSRYVGGNPAATTDTALAMILVMDGKLDKDQRDVFYRNLFQASSFWEVVPDQLSDVCFRSPMEKNVCFSSHIKKR